jgi:hypothetical protein
MILQLEYQKSAARKDQANQPHNRKMLIFTFGEIYNQKQKNTFGDRDI